MDVAALSKILRENGVVGAGGAGFPSYAKLNTRCETVLLNCAECEPLLRLHRQLLAKETEDIISAFEEVRKAVGAKEGIICVKEHYADAIEAVTSVISEYKDLKICTLPPVYPAGDEVAMIYRATGKVVRPGGLPIEVGVIVYNVETIYNAKRAMEGSPVTSKLVTIAGEVKNPVTVRVPIGARLSEVIELAGGETAEDCVFWVGGPMMGVIAGKDAPITKTTNSVFVLPRESYIVNKLKTDNKVEMARAAACCCQCRLCTDLCPRHNLGHPIEPHKIMLATACNNFKDVNAFLNTFYCCACGVCELFACPQGLSPRKLIQLVKGGLRANGIKPENAVQSAVNPAYELRSVPIDRLIARLGVGKYRAKAPLDNGKKTGFDEVKILCSQHIGAPAKPSVKVGDRVNEGDVIATAADGLSVNIHASIDGTVTAVTERAITIKAK